MFPKSTGREILEHQIEELLLNAHFECEAGIDLVEEYFSISSSLDPVTEYARTLLEEQSDPHTQEAILRNFSECIVVKNQQVRRSPMGLAKRALAKVGFSLGKNREIARAEQLVEQIRKMRR